MINKLTHAWILQDIKTKSKYQVFTKEKFNQISAGIRYTSHKSLRCLAHKIRVSKSSKETANEHKTLKVVIQMEMEKQRT